MKIDPIAVIKYVEEIIKRENPSTNVYWGYNDETFIILVQHPTFSEIYELPWHKLFYMMEISTLPGITMFLRKYSDWEHIITDNNNNVFKNIFI